MQGKNKGRKLPFRRRPSKETHAPLTAFAPKQTSNDPPNEEPIPRVPRKFGSELSTIQFADDVDPKLVEPVLLCKFYMLSPVFHHG